MKSCRAHEKPGDTLPIGELGEFSVIGAGTFYSANYIPSTLFEALKWTFRISCTVAIEKLEELGIRL